jgi:amino acid transporter
MTAGWDHLIPAWFSRLHPRYRTPTNSILVAAVLIFCIDLLGSAGVHAEEAFNVLNNASTELYAVAYLSMFAIPVLGYKLFRGRIPVWAAVVSAVGFVTSVAIIALNAYPFDASTAPVPFAAKILGATLLINILGLLFYKLRKPAVSST